MNLELFIVMMSIFIFLDTCQMIVTVSFIALRTFYCHDEYLFISRHLPNDSYCDIVMNIFLFLDTYQMIVTVTLCVIHCS